MQRCFVILSTIEELLSNFRFPIYPLVGLGWMSLGSVWLPTFGKLAEHLSQGAYPHTVG